MPQLAELIRTRRISSTELTKMYLARLKKYGPKLLCVVTLTEDLALKQAAAADAEIKRGKYRGPLHGIPWGAKGSLRDQRNQDDVGRRALSRSGDRLRLDRRRTTERSRGGAGREVFDGRAGAGRAMVCGRHAKSLGSLTKRNRARVARRRVRRRQRRRAWLGFRSARKLWARSFRRRRVAE